MLGDGQCQGVWERVTVAVGGRDAVRVVERAGAGVGDLGLDRGRGIDDRKVPIPEKRSLCSTVRTTSMPETT